MYIRKNSYLENFLNKIKDNTSNNNHSDNVMLIISHYGTDNQKEECFELLQDHLKKGSLSSIVSTARKYLLKDVLNNIEEPNISNEIMRRL